MARRRGVSADRLDNDASRQRALEHVHHGAAAIRRAPGAALHTQPEPIAFWIGIVTGTFGYMAPDANRRVIAGGGFY